METYLAWNLHEPEEPANPDDFSKLRDMEQIGDFIQTARDLGLYVIIRPGPYICAEWGSWRSARVADEPSPRESAPRPVSSRSNSPEMLAWDRHWFTAVAKIVKPHLITNVPRDQRA